MMAQLSYYEALLTEEYKVIRDSGAITFEDAERVWGKPLTDAGEWAVWDNKQDQVLVDMGR